MNKDYHPDAFIDYIQEQRHLVLLYEESEYARALEFRFLKAGILKGETAIYAMHDDVESIEIKMRDYGIDVDEAKTRGLLRVYNVPDPREDREGLLHGAEKIWANVTAGIKSPFRIVSRMITSIDTFESSQANLELESYWHTCFDKSGCILMCPYHVNECTPNIRKEWLVKIMQSHHYAIFASKLGSGIAFSIQ